jgi:hypothetical protein
MFHVTATANRSSILKAGLDVELMTVSGIAGSAAPEASGIQLVAHLDEAWWFASFPTHDEVDIWDVNTDGLQLRQTHEGWIALNPISPERLRLVAAGVTTDEARSRLSSEADHATLEGEMTIRLRHSDDAEQP